MWKSISLSVWPLVAIWAMINHTFSSCSWTMDTDMVLCSSPDPDVTMVLIGNTGHLVQHGPSGMALEHPWPKVAVQTPGIYVAVDGNRSLGYQHRPCLLLDHGPRQYLPIWPQFCFCVFRQKLTVLADMWYFWNSIYKTKTLLSFGCYKQRIKMDWRSFAYSEVWIYE